MPVRMFVRRENRIVTGKLPGGARWCFPVPLVVAAIFTVIVAAGAARLENGIDLAGGPSAVFAVGLGAWSIAILGRRARPTSRAASAIEALALFATLSLLGSFASAALAIGSGSYVDDTLVRLDRAIFPFFDWPAAMTAFHQMPLASKLSGYLYSSINWQPFLLVMVVTCRGTVRGHERFITAWALGLALCVLPFHWLPALSPYNYYGIGWEDVGTPTAALAWQFLPIMEGLRSGSIDQLSVHTLSGMVTMPSFHACAAVILAWCFWPMRKLRWPMLALNIGMFASAVPSGGHYLIDLGAGAAVAGVAIAATNRWLKLGDRHRAGSRILPASRAAFA